MSLIQHLKNLRVRHKLLFSYAFAFIAVLSLSSMVMYGVMRQTIQVNIESELTNSTSALLNMVRTAMSVSIKNYLRAAAEKNLEMVQHFYHRYQRGEMTEAEAKQMAEAVLLGQKIGTTGYIACVNSAGTMVIHPQRFWVGRDITDHAFVQEMISRKEGYIEYEWKNPGEDDYRPKALYCTYFAPWDWIINVSSYRREFSRLVNVNDFRDGVLAMHFARSGYSFILDSDGRAIIHPSLEGVNLLAQDGAQEHPIRTMLAEKQGKLVYEWRNPGEAMARNKLVIYTDLPEYGWVLASSSYLDEVHTPLDDISRVIIITGMACLVILLPVTFWIGGSITQPLKALIDQMDLAARGDLSGRLRIESTDEVGRLASYFNTFMDRLQTYSRSLENEIAERKEAEAALRLSEEKHRSVMEAIPDPIIVYDTEGRVAYLNPAFTRVYGWTPDECLGRRMDHFVPAETHEQTRQNLDRLASGLPLTSMETRRFTKRGNLIEVSISSAVYRDREGRLLGSVTIHRDISELRRLEKQVMDIGDRERQNIGQDLHDDLGPHLIGIEGLCTVLQKKVEQRSPDAPALSARITGLIKEAIGKTRRLARGLCPVYLVDHGLEYSLRELAASTSAVFGIDCRFDCRTEVPIRDNVVATHIFRIIQEAVQNAARHGKATRVTISLCRDEGLVRLAVCDNGTGLSETTGSEGMGLRIMGFRAKMIRATLDFGQVEGGGCRVTLTLPQEMAVAA
jgi:PAS domain S-box-containing protein